MRGEIKELDIKGFSLSLENKIFSMNQSADNFSISTHQHWAHVPASAPVTCKGNWLYHDWLRPNITHPIHWSHVSKPSWGLVHRQDGSVGGGEVLEESA